MPEVSVIIPNYNHSDFLTQRIESILNQTFQDFEIIFLDDCSTDNSRDIIESYRSHPKVAQIVFNEENSASTFKQWEKGIELSSGKYIWIAESDDWCEPNLLQYLLKGFELDKACVISYCQSYLVQEGNSIIAISRHNYLSEVIDGDPFLRNLLLLYNPIINASMVLWKKEGFHKISPEFKKYKLCGDWLFWMELSLQGKVHVSGRVLNYFRTHLGNISTDAFKSGLNFIETLKIINELYERKIISPRDYNKAFKIQYRNYSEIKSSLGIEVKKEVDQLFSHPLTKKTVYYKILLSAKWRQIKQ